MVFCAFALYDSCSGWYWNLVGKQSDLVSQMEGNHKRLSGV
ncbi:hypothetical protein LEP1GSC017_2809 [Leptospira meyeri serovar Hardjo str. Went 5]|nr:hypothetical protein LEP1GSC017_2809 [Leptospira meyeri serovar Hardjo str. Went 5]